MQNTKTIFVTGATGNQGGAVVTSLLHNGFKVKALVRDPASVRAQQLQKSDVELVRGDLDDSSTFRSHLEGIDGIFSVQTFINGTAREIKQGIALADLAKACRVGHFVYSSVAGADLNTGVPHFDSKLEIENHIKKLDLPYTIIRPNSFFENFLIPQVRSRIEKGKLSSPINEDKIQQFISAGDIGKISADVFLHPEKYLQRTITIGTEQMSMNEVANAFSEVLGKEVKYQKLPMFITRIVMGKNLYKMFGWINANDAIFMKDLAGFKRENPGLTSLKQWIAFNFKTGV